jgi:hypothetical protein
MSWRGLAVIVVAAIAGGIVLGFAILGFLYTIGVKL